MLIILKGKIENTRKNNLFIKKKTDSLSNKQTIRHRFLYSLIVVTNFSTLFFLLNENG